MKFIYLFTSINTSLFISLIRCAEAKPTAIKQSMEAMGVHGLTLRHVKSHLQVCIIHYLNTLISLSLSLFLNIMQFILFTLLLDAYTCTWDLINVHIITHPNTTIWKLELYVIFSFWSFRSTGLTISWAKKRKKSNTRKVN